MEGSGVAKGSRGVDMMGGKEWEAPTKERRGKGKKGAKVVFKGTFDASSAAPAPKPKINSDISEPARDS